MLWPQRDNQRWKWAFCNLCSITMQSDLMLMHSRRVSSRRGNLIWTQREICMWKLSGCCKTQRGKGRQRYMEESTTLLLYDDAKRQWKSFSCLVVVMAAKAHKALPTYLNYKGLIWDKIPFFFYLSNTHRYLNGKYKCSVVSHTWTLEKWILFTEDVKVCFDIMAQQVGTSWTLEIKKKLFIISYKAKSISTGK